MVPRRFLYYSPFLFVRQWFHMLRFCFCFFFCFCFCFFLSLFAPYLFSFGCLWKAVLRNCGIFWVSSLIFIFFILFALWEWSDNFHLARTGTQYSVRILILLLLNTTCPVLANSVDPDQLASEEANWSESALFVIKYVKFYQKPGSSYLIGWKLEVGVPS